MTKRKSPVLPFLTAEAILSADDQPKKEVKVPEWGGSVWVRTMSSVERDKYEKEVQRSEDSVPDNFRAKLAVKTVCDKDGNLLFSEDQAEALGKKSAKVLDRIFSAIMSLNGFSDKDIAELQGN